MMKRPHPAIAGYGLACVLWIGAILVGVIPAQGDALNFYNHLDPPYAVHDYAQGAGFYYAPPVWAILRFVAIFGPQVFYAVMVGIGLASVGWIGGRWAFALLFFPPVWWDINAGNVNTLIGLATIAMLARPQWILVPLLTKITPGIVGLWWVVRGDRRALERAGIAVLFIVVTTLPFPDLWVPWLVALTSNGTSYVPGIFAVPIPLLPRLAVAVLLIVWGARQSRQWTLPLAACLALPVLWWSGIAVAAAALHEAHPIEVRLARVRGVVGVHVQPDVRHGE